MNQGPRAARRRSARRPAGSAVVGATFVLLGCRPPPAGPDPGPAGTVVAVAGPSTGVQARAEGRTRGPPEQVWDLLTDTQTLVRLFPVEVALAPGSPTRVTAAGTRLVLAQGVPERALQVVRYSLGRELVLALDRGPGTEIPLARYALRAAADAGTRIELSYTGPQDLALVGGAQQRLERLVHTIVAASGGPPGPTLTTEPDDAATSRTVPR